MTIDELSVWGVEDKPKNCTMEAKETSDNIDSFTCEIKSSTNPEFQQLLVNISFMLTKPNSCVEM